MKRIISVSRRTDIPAFYGDWFMGRLKDAFAGVVHPYGGKKYIVTLVPQETTAFVFWSKNFTPFLDNLKVIEQAGYKFYFNYTVTSLPDVFEGNLDKAAAIESLKKLSRMYSPKHINWRFDPIIISSISDGNFYIRSFERLVSQFAGLVERCYISFVTEYDKVRRNFADFTTQTGIRILEVSRDFKIELANELADIAAGYGIELFSCCGDYLVGPKIRKAHCIDGEIIEQLFYTDGLQYKTKPTRKECACTESTDIGAYDTCPHGCVYCYANANKRRVYETANKHQPNSAFLGRSKAESNRWIAEIKTGQTKKDDGRFKLF